MELMIFLQKNAQWICGLGMLVFAGIQVWLLHKQNRQQIRLERLSLAQRLNEVCAHFPYDKKSCHVIMDWLMANGASFSFLLDGSDLNKYWDLYDFIHELQCNKNPDYFENMDLHDKFYCRVIKLETALREASYGIAKKHKLKKFLKKFFNFKRKHKKYKNM